MEPYHKVQNSNQMSSINEKKIGEVWSKHNFDTNKVKIENLANLSNVPAVWGASRRDESGEGKTTDEEINENAAQNLIKADDSFSETGDQMEDTTHHAEPSTPDHEETSPSHHARRPPNAFLIFCKKHRPIVRQRYPTTENRGVTKILGEWWALLNAAEKQPYNDLAKEYKDAFLSANPDFRWYKLPAPPLRTLTTRPTTISKPVPTISSPPPTLLPSEFTPGKLADESQLGGLTSLMNNNYTLVKKDDTYCCKAEDNNNEDPHIQTIPDTDKILANIFSSPTNTITATMPPKPIKKRFFEHHEEEKNCSKKIFDENSGDMTHQELLNKVVDNIYANDKEEPREQRKSDRMCKGKRYELFMVEGKLLGHKRDSSLTQHNRYSRIDSKIEQELSHTKHSLDPPKLENTIKRLAKRTNVKIDFESEESKQKQTEPTMDSPVEKSSTINFNLDMRIDNLDSLNYDDFIKRKRESKKRKMKIKSDVGYKIHQRADNNNVSNKPEATPVVGSKKRKNKQSITHLNKTEPEGGSLPGDNALLGLATLAMVAASTEKIGENSST
ncbi:uncharacterized protein LOC115891486 isoform X2 [Sitophilus oryzae]|nr:uncharacterized protein LOC115891486 isoform X2 [Sitophilus oryzae]